MHNQRNNLKKYTITLPDSRQALRGKRRSTMHNFSTIPYALWARLFGLQNHFGFTAERLRYCCKINNGFF